VENIRTHPIVFTRREADLQIIINNPYSPKILALRRHRHYNEEGEERK